MNFKLTNKAVKNSFARVYACGYCSMHYLLHFCDRIGYTVGVYGWNADIYEINTGCGMVALATGYRPFGESLDYHKVAENEDKAREVSKAWASGKISREEAEKQTNALLMAVFA